MKLDLRAACAHAAAIVATWPAWKQKATREALEGSPTVSVPRVPITYDAHGMYSTESEPRK